MEEWLPAIRALARQCKRHSMFLDASLNIWVKGHEYIFDRVEIYKVDYGKRNWVCYINGKKCEEAMTCKK